LQAHPFAVIEKQTEALGLPHSVEEIEGPDYNAAYVKAMRKLCVHEGEETWGLVTGELGMCNLLIDASHRPSNIHLLNGGWILRMHTVMLGALHRTAQNFARTYTHRTQFATFEHVNNIHTHSLIIS
jgi:hypothetical protein